MRAVVVRNYGVAGTYPLADAARAHERLEAAGLRGRLVIVP